MPPRRGRCRRRQRARGAARVVGRHEILRTTFIRRQGMKMPARSSTTGSTSRGGSDDLVIARRCRRPWRRPVVRGGAVDETDGHHLLALTLPAVCSDAHSLALLAGELRAELAETATAPAEPLQYADYAEWRLESLAAESSAWELEDLPPSPDLPFVRHSERSDGRARCCARSSRFDRAGQRRSRLPCHRAGVRRGLLAHVPRSTVG